MELAIHVLDSQRVRVEGTWSGSMTTVAVKEAEGTNVLLQKVGATWRFDGINHRQYFMRIAGISED